MINILILASGRHKDKEPPTCIQEYKGKTILQYIKEQSLEGIDANYTFAFLENDMKQYHLDSIAKVLAPEADIVALQSNTGGSACTALYAACKLQQDTPLLIISTNEIVDICYADVLSSFENDADGGIMTFSSVHPRYSYIKLLNSSIVEVCQQKPLSNYATTGSFWFRKTSFFVNAAKKSIFNNCVTSNQFYIAPVYNQMLLDGMKIHHYDVEGHYIPFKADMPSDFSRIEAKEV
ncbi:MAG: hypothetical protein CMF52_04215 [Legionellales bacterium]|nr:hypothetical protein [Legionellales bacterium]